MINIWLAMCAVLVTALPAIVACELNRRRAVGWEKIATGWREIVEEYEKMEKTTRIDGGTNAP